MACEMSPCAFEASEAQAAVHAVLVAPSSKPFRYAMYAEDKVMPNLVSKTSSILDTFMVNSKAKRQTNGLLDIDAERGGATATYLSDIYAMLAQMESTDYELVYPHSSARNVMSHEAMAPADGVFVYALTLVGRMIDAYDFALTPENVKLTFGVLLCVSSKMLYDEHIPFNEYAQFLGVDVELFAEMETVVVSILRFDLNVSREIFYQVLRTIKDY